VFLTLEGALANQSFGRFFLVVTTFTEKSKQACPLDLSLKTLLKSIVTLVAFFVSVNCHFWASLGRQIPLGKYLNQKSKVLLH
jgi:hypothetical protein